MQDNPCYKCEERWVTSNDRCHSHCNKYKQWRIERDKLNDAIQQEIIENDQASSRYKRKIKCQEYFRRKENER